MCDIHEPVLDYFHADPDESGDRDGHAAGAISLACALVPIAGLVLKNAFMLLLGFSFSAGLGILFGLYACVAGCRNESFRVIAWIGLILNLGFGGFGAWVLFVHGIC